MAEEKAISLDDLRDIKSELEKIKRYTIMGAKSMLTADEVADYTGLKKSYIYLLTSQKEIPHYKPNGRTLYFSRSEIDAWMSRNRQNAKCEAEGDALAYVVNNQAKGGRA